MRQGYGEAVYLLPIEEASNALSAWSEAELEQIISTLETVLESKRSTRER
jgi:hypothetical protein